MVVRVVVCGVGRQLVPPIGPRSEGVVIPLDFLWNAGQCGRAVVRHIASSCADMNCKLPACNVSTLQAQVTLANLSALLVNFSQLQLADE